MKNKTYWNLRAKKNKKSFISTTNFNLIKDLEISILKYLINKYTKKNKLKILELGCGNGANLIGLKKALPKFEFYGIDYSNEMIKYAKKQDNKINFFLADITNTQLYKELPKFDIIFTNRCLINLKSEIKIQKTIKYTNPLLKKGGHYIFLENFVDGHSKQNKLRKILNLNYRKVAKFNKFLNEKSFLKILDKYFKIKENINYSSLNDLLLYILTPQNSSRINYNSKTQKKLIFLMTHLLDQKKFLLKLNYNSGQNNFIVCRK